MHSKKLSLMTRCFLLVAVLLVFSALIYVSAIPGSRRDATVDPSDLSKIIQDNPHQPLFRDDRRASASSRQRQLVRKIPWEDILAAVGTREPFLWHSHDPFYRPFASRGIFFSHFSKSGGTTFKATLKQYLRAHNLTWCQNKLAAPVSTPRPLQMCGSHEPTDPLALGQTSPEHDFSTVLMVREPIERLLSEYAWFYRYQGHLGAPRGDTDPLLKYQDLHPDIKNRLRETAFEDLIEQLDSGSSSTLCVFLGRDPRAARKGNCTLEEFERARAALLRYDLVLSTFHFDESVALFAYKFLLPDKEGALSPSGSLHYSKRKVLSKAIKPSDLTEDMLHQLRLRLKLDYSLYELAVKLFDGALNKAKKLDPLFGPVLEHYQNDQAKLGLRCLQDDTANFKTCL